MTSRCYVDPYSRKYCFDCPTYDCVGDKSLKCPIRQAKKRHREEREEREANAIAREFSTRQLSTRYNIYPALILSWLRDDKIPAEKVRLKNRRLLIHHDALPIIEELVSLYKPYKTRLPSPPHRGD